MKSLLRKLTLSSLGLAVLAQGQTTPPPLTEQEIMPVELVPMKPERLNRVSLSYRMGLNITADFKHLGGLSGLSNPNLHSDPAFGGHTVRTYDHQAYNGVDITDNDHGPGFENTTWFWGYGDPNAVHGNQLVFSSSSSPANATSKDNSDDPQHGFELAYSRQLFRKDNWRFGVEGALGYSRLSISDSRTIMATVSQITDSFTIPNSVSVPPAPYTGTFEGPGAVIGDTPTRTTSVISEGATITGERSLDANVYSLRLGPYAEVPLNDKFSLMFNAGLYLAAGNSRFKFQETVTIPGTGTEVHSGSGSQTDFLIGGYVGANVAYALTEDVALFVGAQFQSAGRPVNKENGKEAIINLDKSVMVSIGATYSF